MIEWHEDETIYFDNIVPYDMYVDGVRVYAWMCYYVNSKRWRFRGDGPTYEFPYRDTREAAETDAIAWWAAKQLEEM